MKEDLVFVGTYTKAATPGMEKSGGIYVYRMNAEDGSLSPLHSTQGITNPSFLALHPNGNFLYAVNETAQFEGHPGGGVSAFSINPQTGVLNSLNQQLSQGADPCHISVEATGKFVLVANYSGGSLSLLPIDTDGRLHPAGQVIQHTGAGIDPQRQEGPHVHSVNLDPNNRFLIVADLGLDKLAMYHLDLAGSRLLPLPELDVNVQAGAGPRHLDFHPSGRFVYLINELNSTLTAFAYDPEQGRLYEIQTVPTLPQDFQGTNWPADVHVAPSGKFLYGSNRLHDSLVIFAVDQATGRLNYVGHEPTGGLYPRNFVIDPSGKFLLAANQNSGTIVTFRVNEQTGKLSPTGQILAVPSPVCIKFLEA